MIYVLTEDTNSGRYFWYKVLCTFRGKENFRLSKLPCDDTGKPYGGNTSLEKQLSNVLNIAKPGDEILAVIDNIEGDLMAEFYLSAKRRCREAGVGCMFTPYYCFEELYLSYSGLIELYKAQNNIDIDLLNTLEYVRNCIIQDRNYFKRKDSRVQTLIKRDSGAGKNREHFANVLLSTVTSKIKGHFRITKRKNGFGECWLDSCLDIIESDSDVSYTCGACKYCCKGCNTKEKLLDLRHRSLLALSDKGV